MKIKIENEVGYGFVGVWSGDNIPVAEIPSEDIHPFWNKYEYTHGGKDWRTACEKISDMKNQGHVFKAGEEITIE